MSEFVTIQDGTGARAVVAPGLGGWLLRYVHPTQRHGEVEVLHFSQAVVDRYPLQMYAGNPLLFPLVSFNHLPGREHHYEWNGRAYALPQHGFARRLPWAVGLREADRLTMSLADSEETRRVYPFAFLHEVTYGLEEGRLVFEQAVTNRSDETMPFGAGIHPYFNVPLTSSGDRAACFVEIPEADRAEPDGATTRFTLQRQAARRLAVAEDVSGTLLLTNFGRKELRLVDPRSGLAIRLDFSGAPGHRHAAIWSKSTSDPFYCLEPWTSLPNAFSRTGDRDLVLLPPGETFRARMTIDLETWDGQAV